MSGLFGWGAGASVCLFVFAIIAMLSRQERRDKELMRLAVSKLNWSESISPLDFERYCSEFLRVLGWNSQLTKASGDQSADIVAWKGNFKVVCQCKKYSRAVGNKAVQETYAAKQYYSAAAGAVISNATFTRAAIELAKATDVKLLHFSDLLHFNSAMIPGSADVDPAVLSQGEIESDADFRRKQGGLGWLAGLSALGGFICILGLLMDLPQ
jgi:hypothetical protein